MPGIVISVDDRVKIFEYLHRIGIEKLEVFLFNKSDKEAALRMLDHDCTLRLCGTIGFGLPFVMVLASLLARLR